MSSIKDALVANVLAGMKPVDETESSILTVGIADFKVNTQVKKSKAVVELSTRLQELEAAGFAKDSVSISTINSLIASMKD